MKFLASRESYSPIELHKCVEHWEGERKQPVDQNAYNFGMRTGFSLDHYERMLIITRRSEKNAEAQKLSQSEWRTGLQDL
jgi:hypothetical protein